MQRYNRKKLFSMDQEIVRIVGREEAHPVDIVDLLKKNKVIKKLDIDNYDLTDYELIKICKVLKQNHSLNELLIFVVNYDSWHPWNSYGAINGEGAIALAEVISANTSLHTVHLVQDIKGISPESAITLTSAVCRNQNIKNFSLSIDGYDKINDIMAPFKSNKTLKELSLRFYPEVCWSKSYLRETEVQCIVDSLRLDQSDCSLDTLYLGRNGIDGKALQPLINSLKKNISLRALILTYNPIGNEGFLLLSELLTANLYLRKLHFSTYGVDKAEEKGQQINQLIQHNGQNALSSKTIKDLLEKGGRDNVKQFSLYIKKEIEAIKNKIEALRLREPRSPQLKEAIEVFISKLIDLDLAIQAEPSLRIDELMHLVSYLVLNNQVAFSQECLERILLHYYDKVGKGLDDYRNIIALCCLCPSLKQVSSILIDVSAKYLGLSKNQFFDALREKELCGNFNDSQKALFSKIQNKLSDNEQTVEISYAFFKMFNDNNATGEKANSSLTTVNRV